MRRSMLVVAAAFTATLVAACSSGPSPPTLADALRQQPAGVVRVDTFAADTRTGGCPSSRTATIVSLSPAESRRRWTRTIPWTAQQLAVVDGRVLAVDQSLGDVPPSVMAADASTGQPQWRRYVASVDLQMVGTTDGTVAVLSDSGKSVVGLDPENGSIRWKVELARRGRALGVTDRTFVISEIATDPRAATIVQIRARDGKVVGRTGLWHTPTPDAVAVAPDGVVLVRLPPLGVPLNRSAVLRASPTGDLAWRWPPSVPAEWDFGAPGAVQASNGAVLVSFQRPAISNEQIVVLDAENGSERWQLDGVRDATIAGPVVLVDRPRHTSSDEALSRELQARDVVTGHVLWTEDVGPPLGGYVGTFGREGLFLMGNDPSAGVARRDLLTGNGGDEQLRGWQGPSDAIRGLATDGVVYVWSEHKVAGYEQGGQRVSTYRARSNKIGEPVPSGGGSAVVLDHEPECLGRA